MTDSVYAPPKADLSPSSEAGSDGDNAFYVVSMRKFALLFIFTFGLYRVYWLYKNWSRYKERCRYAGSTGADVWPVPRAIFSIFFIHSLFYKVEEYAEQQQRPLHWKVDTDATILVLTLIVSNISSRLWDKDIGSPYTGFIWVAAIVPLFISFRRAQRFINISCGDPDGASNSKLSAANWVWMSIGAIFWLMVMIGLALPDVPG